MTGPVRRVVLAARPQGMPKLTDFRIEDAAMPEAGDGEVLLRTLVLSLDPYMRGRMDDKKSYTPGVAIGGVMDGESVAEVVASNHPGYRPGELVQAQTGWQTHRAVAGEGLQKVDPAVTPITAVLGILGMPGFSAYVGLRGLCRPKPGETLAVAAAMGPVGSLVGQLAKQYGARVVGIAGGPAKCAHLRDRLGFDVAIDHRAADFPEQLANACPNGIDVYFENVGGAVWQAVLPLLNRFARVSVCGLVANYNVPPDQADTLPATMRAILTKSLTVQGFINYDMIELYPEFRREIADGVRDGTYRYSEDIAEGLDRAPEAFIGMLQGRNFGKQLVRVAG